MSLLKKIMDMKGWRWVIGLGVFAALVLLTILIAQLFTDSFFKTVFGWFGM